MEVEKLIEKYALKNALDYNGKANPGAVLGKVLAEEPGLKNKVLEIRKIVEEVCKSVNSLSLAEIKKQSEKYTYFERKKEERVLPELPKEFSRNIVSLFPPEPSKYPHIGHAKAAYINYLYAKEYNGKFVLRFEDNNPELVKQEYVDAIIKGLNWLGIKWDVEDYVSNHIDEFYSITKELIERGKAYLCNCEIEKSRRLRFKGMACQHRDQTIEDNLGLWEEMLKGRFREGEITVRLKIDIAHQNTAMRDPSIMRISTHRHFRTGRKYIVWPLYDFATAVMDKFNKITFRIRSKEFEMRAPLQAYIHRLINYKSPYINEIARFNLEGVEASGRKIREMIKKGEIRDWSDPRLSTLAALKRRGFVAEAIKEFLITTGFSKTESTISWDVLYSINRRHIDSKAKRYFFVYEPVEIKIEGLPKKGFVEAPLHPEQPKLGKRKIPLGEKFYIEKKDFEKFKDKEVRLLHLANIKLGKKAEYTGNEIKEIPKIHWISDNYIKIKIVMNNGQEIEGLAEPDFKKAKVGENVQFERFGFVRIDSKKRGENIVCYFTHK